MKTILSVFGTRPETIKMAPIVKELENSKNFRGIVCVTAQHRHMLDQCLDVFEIKPDYDLDIMQDNQSLFSVTSRALTGLSQVIKETKPDLILVQGDTTTAFVAALAAFYLKIPVGHVEAGLRTCDKYSPFPEEMNRQLTDVITDFYFAPTEWAKKNLLKENVPRGKIFVTGNPVVDALFEVRDRIKTPELEEKFNREFRFLVKNENSILITGHRRESFGEGFKNICRAIYRLAKDFPDYNFIYPVHLNPNVQKPVKEILGQGKLSNIHLIKPLEYLPFVYLMQKAHFILTDSGGIQEEAISLNRPVLVMRDRTERPEGVKTGAVRIVGTNQEAIYRAAKGLLESKAKYKRMINKKNPYGDGQAAKKIAKILAKKL